MTQVTITQGEHKGQKATVTQVQKEEIGNGKLYQLKDADGIKIWNGQFSNFPESFVKPS